MVLGPKLVQSNLSESQGRAVLHTIAFPGFEEKKVSTSAPLPKPTLSTLSRLHIHFLLAFPFEALSMNYEPSGCMDATLSHTFDRFIGNGLGGGYCLQVNLLYREMLSFLGFRYIGVLGRVYSPISQDWSGLTHTASLVYLPSHLPKDQGKKVYYLSDVGFGSSPHRPILLRHGWEEYGRGSDKYRLVKSQFQPRSTLEQDDEKEQGAGQVDQEVQAIAASQSCWTLQNLKKGKQEWEDCYSFSTFECFYPDYQASNKATSHHASVPFATMILVVRYLLNPNLLSESSKMVDKDGLDSDLYPYHPSVVEQRMIVGDKYIVKIGDDQNVFKVIQSERERVELLKRDFGLLKHIQTETALEVIAGKPSALKTEGDKVKMNGKVNGNGNENGSAH
ncbi:uncharacterized protein UTRI_01735 [Ustilago trichophora]|uniref:Uncharacterized protein n=1 Tax=Ustilago trichophora TaxID=86804 RepID=A0A5C3E0J0_9BASI|nr:uncharacterized protein UTRI_01735 [Ustilago trichophora]